MGKRDTSQPTRLKGAMRRLASSLGSLPEVWGVGMGGEHTPFVLRVFVSELTPDVRKQVPTTFESIPVEIVKDEIPQPAGARRRSGFLNRMLRSG